MLKALRDGGEEYAYLCYNADGAAALASTCCATYSVDISFAVTGQIVVYHKLKDACQ